jgi:mono/diheme cytochrome c family protein
MKTMMSFVTWSISICLVIAVTACSGSPKPPEGLNETQLAGWQAYVDLNCASCHGEAREGQRSGPALTGLSAHWTADELVGYLADPDASIKKISRLARIAGNYAVRMPGMSGKTPGYADKAREEKLRALAEYLLVDTE